MKVRSNDTGRYPEHAVIQYHDISRNLGACPGDWWLVDQKFWIQYNNDMLRINT